MKSRETEGLLLSLWSLGGKKKTDGEEAAAQEPHQLKKLPLGLSETEIEGE